MVRVITSATNAVLQSVADGATTAAAARARTEATLPLRAEPHLTTLRDWTVDVVYAVLHAVGPLADRIMAPWRAHGPPPPSADTSVDVDAAAVCLAGLADVELRSLQNALNAYEYVPGVPALSRSLGAQYGVTARPFASALPPSLAAPMGLLARLLAAEVGARRPDADHGCQALRRWFDTVRFFGHTASV